MSVEVREPSMTDIGREFEEDFAEDMGLSVVPGSGNQWHSKLDVHGRGVRWSLKATRDHSFRVTEKDIKEMVLSVMGPGATGDIGMMAIRINAEGNYPMDLIVMGKSDFKALAGGEYKLVTETKSDAKRRAAHIPELLRGDDDE